MVVEGEAQLLWEGSACRVVRGWGEGHEDRVSVEGEDNPSGLQERSLVADCVAEDCAVLGGKATLLGLAEGEALDEVL